MRIFGTPGGDLNNFRATVGFLTPFDLQLASPDAVLEWVDKGGFLLDLSGHTPLGLACLGYFYFAYVPNPALFNPQIDSHPIIADASGGATVGVDAYGPNVTVVCDC